MNASPSALAPRLAATWRRAVAEVHGHLIEYTLLIGVFVVIATGILVLRHQYYPDSAHYLAMSLWFSGMPRAEALQVVFDRSVAIGYEPNTTEALLFDWGLVKPRVVLPALSVPFIWIFGPNGLAVTTTLITFVLVIVGYRFLRAYYGRVPALITMLLTMSSMYIMVFSIGMLTESLSALWGVITLALAYRYQRHPHWGYVAGLVVVTVLSGFTRQATFIVAGAFFVAWLLSLPRRSERSRWHLPALAVVGTAVVVQVLQTVLFPFSQANQWMRMTETDNLWDALLATPALVKGIVVNDLASFALADQAMLVFLALSGVSLIVFWRRSESHLLLGALLGIALYNITNGTSTQFRYAIPGLVFFLANIALLLFHVQSRIAQNRVGTPALLAGD